MFADGDIIVDTDNPNNLLQFNGFIVYEYVFEFVYV